MSDDTGDLLVLITRRILSRRQDFVRPLFGCGREAALCYEFSSPDGGSTAILEFERCIDHPLDSPSLFEDPIAPDGTFDPLGASPTRTLRINLSICEFDEPLPVFAPGTRFRPCKRYPWRVPYPEGPYRFHLEDGHFVEGGFADWFVWFTVEFDGIIWDPCFVWIPDPEWPFNPSSAEVRWSIRSPSSPGVTERVSPCSRVGAAAAETARRVVRRPLR